MKPSVEIRSSHFGLPGFEFCSYFFVPVSGKCTLWAAGSNGSCIWIPATLRGTQVDFQSAASIWPALTLVGTWRKDAVPQSSYTYFIHSICSLWTLWTSLPYILLIQLSSLIKSIFPKLVNLVFWFWYIIYVLRPSESLSLNAQLILDQTSRWKELEGSCRGMVM